MATEFRCKACGAEFDTKNQLDAHNRVQHPAGANPPGNPGPGSPR
jgi:hypothetical protein